MTGSPYRFPPAGADAPAQLVPAALADAVRAAIVPRESLPIGFEESIRAGIEAEQAAMASRRRAWFRVQQIVAVTGAVLLFVWLGQRYWARQGLPASAASARSVPSALAGDLDRSGRVDILDAFLLARVLHEVSAATSAAVSPDRVSGADLDASGTIDEHDVRAIACRAVGAPINAPGEARTPASDARWYDLVIDAAAPLAAYQVHVVPEPVALGNTGPGPAFRVVRVQGGQPAEFAGDPFWRAPSAESPDDADLVLAAFTTEPAGVPAGRVPVARILIETTDGTEPAFAVRLAVAVDPEMRPIPADAALLPGAPPGATSLDRRDAAGIVPLHPAPGSGR